MRRAKRRCDVEEKYFSFLRFLLCKFRRIRKKYSLVLRSRMANHAVYKKRIDSPSNECVKISYEMFDFDLMIVALLLALLMVNFFLPRSSVLCVSHFSLSGCLRSN
jgi:hypothetical protein